MNVVFLCIFVYKILLRNFRNINCYIDLTMIELNMLIREKKKGF